MWRLWGSFLLLLVDSLLLDPDYRGRNSGQEVDLSCVEWLMTCETGDLNGYWRVIAKPRYTSLYYFDTKIRVRR